MYRLLDHASSPSASPELKLSPGVRADRTFRGLVPGTNCCMTFWPMRCSVPVEMFRLVLTDSVSALADRGDAAAVRARVSRARLLSPGA
ncbi:hypothetical protein AA16373_1429 [Komagataeibacter swingsii DSM 16373]|nr:hypothetical protein AA16373_1429 [Komagataeibacter swingsii DSM 16373]